MNETDFIRQQLAAERAHLREILEAVHRGSAEAGNARPVSHYIEWAGQRLVGQLRAHRSALLAAAPTDPDNRAQLERLSAAPLAESATAPQGKRLADRLLALLDAWDDPLDALAGRTLRVSHWRRAAHLNADTILEERQLYAAARGAAGLS